MAFWRNREGGVIDFGGVGVAPGVGMARFVNGVEQKLAKAISRKAGQRVRMSDEEAEAIYRAVIEAGIPQDQLDMCIELQSRVLRAGRADQHALAERLAREYDLLDKCDWRNLRSKSPGRY